MVQSSGQKALMLRAAGSLLVAMAAASVALLALVLNGVDPVALVGFAPHLPYSAPPAGQTKQQAWAELAEHAPNAPQWLRAASGSAGASLHQRDPNFPVVEPSLAAASQGLGKSERSAPKAHWQAVFPRRANLAHSVPSDKRAKHAQKHARIPGTKQAKQEVENANETPNEEWQALRGKLYKAVHTFHKYGDAALEKLIPAKDSRPFYQKALSKAEDEILALKRANAQGNIEEGSAKAQVAKMKKQLQSEEQFQEHKVESRAEDKIHEAQEQTSDVERKLALAQARDHRRQKIIQAEVNALSKENNALRRRDAKVMMAMAQVPAIGNREKKLGVLESEIKQMQRTEGSDVKLLKGQLRKVKSDNQKLRKVAKAAITQAQQSSAEAKESRAEAEESKKEAFENAKAEAKAEIKNKNLKAKAQAKYEDLWTDFEKDLDARAARDEATARKVEQVRMQEAKQIRRSAAQHHQRTFANQVQARTSKHQVLPSPGFAHTDSALECHSCISGPGCHAGCRMVRKGPHQVQSLKDYDSVSLGAKTHMPPGEEWGNNAAHCKAGNCDPLETQGVKVDGWGFGNSKKGVSGFYRLFPLPSADPGSNLESRRKMNQRRGRFAVYNHAEEDGVYTPPASWGANARFFGHDHSPGAKKLEEKGVNMDGWPNNIYKTVPIPLFDKSVWDHEKNEGRAPEDPIKFNRESNRPMEKAGVLVNKWPQEEFEGEREPPTVDGMPDHLVKNVKIPQYRKEGVAEQEKPVHFLLRSHANLAAAQPEVDQKRGIEHWHSEAMQGTKPGEPGYYTWQDSLGCGPQGCFE